MNVEKLLKELGIQTTNPDPCNEAAETPIEAMMTDMADHDLLTDELIEFMTPYLELERMHIALAFDEGTSAAAMTEEACPPEDGIDYFGQSYTWHLLKSVKMEARLFSLAFFLYIRPVTLITNKQWNYT